MIDYKPNKEITGEYDVNCAARCVNGIFVGKETEGVTAFRGIPFALPPTGELRWREPVPVKPSGLVFEAFYNGPTAIQTKLKSERASFYRQSEDCLYLNVWTANGYEGQSRAVMVFIHGGNYGWGGTADPLYDCHNLVKAHPEVVLVTIAYRVGITGFMDFSEVPGGEEYKTSGNLGLLDQIRALSYIKENIKSFGGDPDNVTVFGESAGGGSVSLLPLIPSAKGLFRRVIAESGSVNLSYSRKECLPLTRLLMKRTGAKNMADLLALTEEELSGANEKLNGQNNFPERDGVVLPEDLYGAYDNGKAFPVDMLSGTNADELRYWIQDVGGVVMYRHLAHVLFDSMFKQLESRDRHRADYFMQMKEDSGIYGRPWQITEFFNELIFRLPAIRQCEAHANNGGRSYLYYWDYPSSIPHMKACHAVELAYVFNNLHETIYTGENASRELAEKVQQMWVNFAVSGDPSIDGVKWKPYTSSSRKTMILGKNIRLEKNWKEKERRCLTPLLKYNFNGNSAAPSFDTSLILKIAAVAAGVGLTAFALYKLLHKGE